MTILHVIAFDSPCFCALPPMPAYFIARYGNNKGDARGVQFSFSSSFLEFRDLKVPPTQDHPCT